MSDFDDWFDNKRPPMYSVHTDRLSQGRCLAEQAFTASREGMIKKADILAMLNTCLDRDPTLQKLVKQIEDMS